MESRNLVPSDTGGNTSLSVDTSWLAGFASQKTKPQITPHTIVETAHRLVHAGGIEALSLRKLASELGVGTTALYGHIVSKENLLIAVADAVLAEVRIPPSIQRSHKWRRDLEAFSHEVRRVLMEHPHLHPILVSQVMVTPATLRIADACVGLLRKAPYEGNALAHAYNAWAGYVFGFAFLEAKPAAEGDSEEVGRRARTYLNHLDPQTYPHLAETVEHLGNRAYGVSWDAQPLGTGGKSFEWGLEVLLDGLERRAVVG